MRGVTERMFMRQCAALLSVCLLTPSVWAQGSAALNIRVHKDNDQLNPTSLVQRSGPSPISGPTSHDDDSDGTTDRISYVFSTPATNVGLNLLGSSESVDRWERTSNGQTFVTEDSISILFGIQFNTSVDLFLNNSPVPEAVPVSCRIVPDANTISGTPRIWGQAHQGNARTITPRGSNYTVNLFSGEVNEKVVDLHVKGRGLDLVWSRSFRSRDGKNARLGQNWDHSYNVSAKLVVYQSQFAYEVKMGNGRTELFRFSHSDGQGLHFFADGWEAELVESDFEDQRLIFGNGSVWDFDPDESDGGNITSIMDRYGNELTFEYDGNDRLETITDTLGREYQIGYGADDLIDSFTESNGLGRVVSYTYYGASNPDGNAGDLESVTYPAITGTVTNNDFPSGRSLTYTYDTSVTPSLQGNLLTIKDGRNNTILTNTYDSNDRVVKQVWGSDGATDAIVKFDYPTSPTGLLSGETQKTIVNDGEGNVTEFFFNASNQLERTREYTGRAIASLVTTETANRPTNKLRSADPDHYETLFEWNVHDLLTERTEPKGNRAVFTYDTTRKRIANVTKIEEFEGAGGTAELTADLTHDATFHDCRCGEQFVTRHTLKDDGGNADYDIAFDIDSAGDRIGVSYGALSGFPTTFHETFEYNAQGQMTEHVFPDNGSSYTRTDVMAYYASGPQTGYLESITADSSGLGLKSSFAYNAAGRVAEVTPPNGHSGGTPQTEWKTLFTYNANDELIRRDSAQPSGTIARTSSDFIYDANGNVVATKVSNLDETGAAYANGVVETTFTYDTLNRQTQTVSEVDASANVTSQTTYTRNGLLLKVLSPLAVASAEPANTEAFIYDERDLVYRVVRGSGDSKAVTTQLDYDANGNLTKTTAGLEESAGNRRVTIYTYDLIDRLDTTTDPLGHVTDYAYDGAGHVVEAKVLQGGSTLLSEVDYTFDLSGRNTVIARSLRNATGSVILGTVNGVATGDGVVTTSMTYTDASDVKTVDFEGNDTVYNYDGLLRVASVTDPRGNVVSYSHDGNSNVTQVATNEEDDTGGADQQFLTQYVYDRLDRLAEHKERYSTDSGGLFNTVKFAYDSRSNLVLQTDA
ncbi:MAG: DUF6531 domain-containing protein, partial [Candidatus Hydrogenedentes bacterium]|nr:DUF6531 domain-containing protein [Candidatus Hydrogenedentota bacterium]